MCVAKCTRHHTYQFKNWKNWCTFVNSKSSALSQNPISVPACCLSKLWSKTIKQKVPFTVSTTDDHISRCFPDQLRGSLPRKNDKRNLACKEQRWHINILELLAVKLALFSFTKNKQDNPFSNGQQLSKEIWDSSTEGNKKFL